MKKKNYTIIVGILIVIILAVVAASLFVFQGDEEGVCKQCKMLNCHDHATGDNYCCDMCIMGENSTCDCPMPDMGDSKHNHDNNNSNITMDNSSNEHISSEMDMSKH